MEWFILLQALTTREGIGGLVFILGAMFTVLVGLYAVLRSEMVRIVDARLQADDSPLGRHRADPTAHESMRDRVQSEIAQDLDGLRTEIERARLEFREETAQFRRDVLIPLLDDIRESRADVRLSLEIIRQRAGDLTPPPTGRLSVRGD